MLSQRGILVIFSLDFLEIGSLEFPSKFLSMYFRSLSSHGYASLPPENFEIPTIKIQMKNYRNVKPMAIGTIYFLNSSTPKQDD